MTVASHTERATSHLRGADGFFAFAEDLRELARPGSHVGWAITALFYSSLHEVRAYLAAKGLHVASHDEFKRLVRAPRSRAVELRKTLASYELLKQKSEAARYYLSDEFSWSDYDEFRERKHRRIRRTWRAKTERRIKRAEPTSNPLLD